jgi:hypothetical protein
VEEGAEEQEEEWKNPHEPRLGMDFFHVKHAVHNHVNKFPKASDVGLAGHQINLLADLNDRLISRATPALLSHWRSQKIGWNKFADYFEDTWVKQLSGWWCGFHGPGTPRTSGGLEGRWPHVHKLLGGQLTVERLVAGLVQVLVPYFHRNQVSSLYNRKLCDELVALDLAGESADRLKTRVISDVRVWFTRRRLLGDSRRPLLSDDDVDNFIDIIDNKKVWSFADFTLVTNIRYFSENMCSCAEFQQHAECTHVLSRRMAEGEEIPRVLPDDVGSPLFSQRKSDAGVRKKITNDPKMRQNFCFVCNISCTNDFNLVAHRAGKKHRGQAELLYEQLDLPGFDSQWNGHHVQKLKAHLLIRGDVVIFQDKTECQAKQGVVVGRVVHGTGNKSCTTKIMLSETKELMVSGGESLFRLIDKPPVQVPQAPVCVHVPSNYDVNRVANIARNSQKLAALGIKNPIPVKIKKTTKKRKPSPQLRQRNPPRKTRDAEYFQVFESPFIF